MIPVNRCNPIKNVALLLSLFAISGFAHGQTLLPPEFSHDAVLIKDNSPYLVQDNLTINNGAVLRVEAGVVIILTSYATLEVNGSLIAQGTAEDSIYFVAQEDDSPWQQINTTNADIELQYCKVMGGRRFLNASGGNNITITHCYIKSAATGNGEDCIAVHDADKVYIAFIKLTGMGGTIAQGSKNDAIDLDNVDSCFVKNSIIAHFSDDGVDIGTNSKYALISNTMISYCNYGVSVGETSTAFINNTIVTHSDAGFQVHTGAIIYCNYNTIYSNTWGIECYHSEDGNVQTGGTAFVKNMIFSATAEAELLTQASSEVTISYSISDKETLPGSFNLFGDPLLTDPDNGNFTLQSNSPCINTGSPDGEGGSRTTMGAINYIGNPTNTVDTKKRVLDFYIYPNPAVDHIRIETTQDGSARKLELYNDLGKLLISRAILQSPVLIDLSSFPAGVYLIRLSSGQAFTVVRVIKK